MSDDKNENGHRICDFYVRTDEVDLLPVEVFECVEKLCRRGRNPLAGDNVEVAETDLGRALCLGCTAPASGDTITPQPLIILRQTTEQLQNLLVVEIESRICRLFAPPIIF